MKPRYIIKDETIKKLIPIEIHERNTNSDVVESIEGDSIEVMNQL